MAETASPKHSLKRQVVRKLVIVLCSLAAFYLLMMVLLYLFQYRLLYFPAPYTREQLVREAKTENLELWPKEGPYRALIRSPKEEEIKGTVIVFHGNAGAAVDRVYYPDHLVPLGYRVLLAEYPGYGARPGKTNERTFVSDAKETVRMAASEFREPIYIVGESLGSGVAAEATGASASLVKGLVLCTPWDSLPNLAQRLYWYFPTRYFVRDTYDSVKNLKAYEGPLAIVMAGDDELIPNDLTMRLYDSFEGPKHLRKVPAGTHNTWFSFVRGKQWLEIMDFVSGDHSPKDLI